MICGIGTDIAKVSRFKKWIDNPEIIAIITIIVIIYIVNDDKGKPTLIAENKAAEIVKEKFGECSIHVSLSHEKEYAIAFVIIER